MIFTELISKFTALMAEGGLIEKTERRAEFVSQVNDITAADKEAALIIHLSGQREED